MARPVDGFATRVLVVDNASTDGTESVVRDVAGRSDVCHIRVDYMFVPTPGKPHALNAGIAATDGELIGLIDDDEEVDAGWFEAIARHFGSDTELDFIGGRCLPIWGAPRPEWLGPGYLGVIGWVDPGPAPRRMDREYPGILMGGNAVIRRSAIDRAGLYSTALSRTGTKLLGCEDEDMYHRLLAVNARGRYVPDLVIHHHVPAGRLTRRYFRRWCFWRGVSLGVMDRTRPAPVRYVAGIPRYQIGRAIRGIAQLIGHSLWLRRQRDPAARFESELACWDLAGFAWGKHLT
jgi:glycosyltransferase involved in cell wall biosynthesis